MKTTLDLDDHLLAEAKERAAASRQTLQALVEEALRAHLLERSESPQGFRLKLPVVGGKGAPAVEIMDREGLYDLLEDRGRS